MEKYFNIKKTTEIIHMNLFKDFADCLKEIQEQKVYNDYTNEVIKDIENIITEFLTLDLTPKMDRYITLKDEITSKVSILYSDPKYDTKFCSDLISLNVYR
jgi:hypothetical protein